MSGFEEVPGRFDPVYVVGGQQREHRSMRELGDGWYGYAKGVILRVAPEGVEVVKEYVSRPGTHAEDDAVLFKSATRRGDRLYCCTQTEVVVFSLPDFTEINHISISRFNDVHHVVPTAHDTLLVANSGLDTVLELTEIGDVVNEWNVLGEDTWALHDVDVDYRIGVNLKPHRGHPNHVFLLGDEPWAARFERKDAVSMLDPERRIDVGGERVHDGVVRDGGVFFTTVDGCVVRAGTTSLEVTDRWQLDDARQNDSILGWCRGLCFTSPVDAGPACWVGFSRIRATKLRGTVSWIRNRGVHQAPTRIARYATTDWSLVDEIDLEPYGLNAVFSIVPAD